MQRYHIRVDKISDKTLDYLKDWIKKHDIKTYLISEEEGTQTGKLHYQGFIDIDTSIRCEKTWRANLRDNLHTTGRNQYSLTLKHGNLETYICKDNNIILKSSDIHPLQIEQWVKDSYKESNKGKTLTFTQKYLKAMSTLPSMDRHNLTVETIKYFRDNTKIFDNFIIKRFVYLAKVTYPSDDNVIERLANLIWE